MEIDTTKELVASVYSSMEKRLRVVRGRFNRPLTFSEKILFGHLADPEKQDLLPGNGILRLRPDRVAMQDATAQMAILQFAQARIKKVKVPTTVHCDHLIRAFAGAREDMESALKLNKEVYDFLSSASKKFGIGFWEPGAGIIHQVVLENYAFPGGLMIGTDSHTPNAGGLGMAAIGVGGADAVDVMAGLPLELKHPTLIGVRLTGSLNDWASPKDVILYVCGLLTVKGGTNRIIEYFGPGASSISCTGKATITNMGAELGATTSIFPFDEKMASFLGATGRNEIAEIARKNSHLLTADSECLEHPENFYEKVIDIDLSKLEPHIVGPHTPDLARPISKLAKEVREKGYPDKISSALIGSCTNSSYEDISRAADVAVQAKTSGIKMPIQFLVTPGSDQIYKTVKRDGQVKAFEEIGGTVLANACGPCIGQWKRGDIKQGEKNSILTSFNRNFPKRNDGNPETMAFIGSPEIVVAVGLAGRLSFNPMTDTLDAPGGKKVKLSPPRKADDLPPKGFVLSRSGYVPPPENGDSMEIQVSPSSERLQLLEPFAAWDGEDLINCPVLLKARGKCTTDHISPAGPWLKYRGHLDKISDNMFLGAVNDFTGEAGKGTNVITGERDITFPQIARYYKDKGIKWVVIGDENYGEGSSREHAAMSPRYLGCAVVIVRSFARIHETNLKKQGILPLTFSDPKDYDAILENDRISFIALKDLAPQKEVIALIFRSEGKVGDMDNFVKVREIQMRHSLTEEQINWFKAGSALNLLKQNFPVSS